MSIKGTVQKLGLSALLSLVACTAMGAQPGQGAGRAYKWVDDQGVTHYGDVVPPEYSQKGRSELNRQGVTVRQFPAQMSEAEAAEAQQSAAETARRRQHDQFLLNTYTKSSDIEQLRDERLALIDSQMSIARGSIESATGRLTAIAARMRNFQPYSASTNARRMPDQLAEEAVRALHERRSLQEALLSRESEKEALRAQFDSDLARYRELTAARQPR